MYYDRQGKPMTMKEWSEAFGDKALKRVAEDTLPNGYWVSTIWLGLDHSYSGGTPIIFETMVFAHDAEKGAGPEGVKNWGELDGDRYSTEAEALIGHAQMVEKWSKMKPGIAER